MPKHQLKPISKKKAPKKLGKKYPIPETLNILREPEYLLNQYLNKIICGDTLTVMKQLPSSSVDLIVTSPPYNLKNSTGNGMSVNTKSGKWDDKIEYCNHCGKSVVFGSGRFVNRVPDFNDILTRMDNGLEFPLGDFVCGECDNDSSLGDEN